MKTYSTKAADIKREWHVIDASDKVLGRLATQIASLLMGKHKPIFSRHLDMGDFVVVINAEKVQVTGNKAKQKLYYRHSGYPGGLKSTSFERMMETHPTRVIEYAVKGMLPH
ncbi:50S ribosomal protein L13, partial [Chloroflexota bacterium]